MATNVLGAAVGAVVVLVMGVLALRVLSNVLAFGGGPMGPGGGAVWLFAGAFFLVLAYTFVRTVTGIR